MKLSESDSKFVEGRCRRRTFSTRNTPKLVDRDWLSASTNQKLDAVPSTVLTALVLPALDGELLLNNLILKLQQN